MSAPVTERHRELAQKLAAKLLSIADASGLLDIITLAEAIADAEARGREAGQGDVADLVHRERARSGESQQAIANHYDVSQSTVSAVLRGKVWSHV